MNFHFLRHLMLLPTRNCLVRWRYCFGPQQGSPLMGRQMLEGVVRWVEALDCSGEKQIILHGGEPLLPPGGDPPGRVLRPSGNPIHPWKPTARKP